VLQRYLKTHPDDDSLHELLDLPDNDLWDIIAGRSDHYDPRFERTVARLRAA
jgi:succinate dehydrogenase flavin-adding protein (antitoxin of CptAB toxin-antitoxin module)